MGKDQPWRVSLLASYSHLDVSRMVVVPLRALSVLESALRSALRLAWATARVVVGAQVYDTFAGKEELPDKAVSLS